MTTHDEAASVCTYFCIADPWLHFAFEIHLLNALFDDCLMTKNDRMLVLRSMLPNMDWLNIGFLSILTDSRLIHD